MFGTNHSVTRRELIRQMGLAALGTTSASWFAPLAQAIATHPGRRRHCILLWMNGGPTQTDTFDMKPHHANGGPFKEVSTSVPGLRFSEHLSKLAAHGEHLAVIRSLITKEGDHVRGAHLVRTGYAPVGDVAYPTMGSALSKELSCGDTILPSYVSIAPQPQLNPAAFGPGFLGPKYAPAIVGGRPSAANNASQGMADMRLENIEWAEELDPAQAARRMKMWQALERKFLADRQHNAFAAHHTLYKQAAQMMHRPSARHSTCRVSRTLSAIAMGLAYLGRVACLPAGLWNVACHSLKLPSAMDSHGIRTPITFAPWPTFLPSSMPVGRA